MANLIAATRDGRVGSAEVVLVVVPAGGTPAEASARELGVDTLQLDPREAGYAQRLLSALATARVEIVCLAGYMTLLPVEVVEAYRGRTLNVHPALLPKFGGRGMYGAHVQEAVLAAGETETGCTVHLVTEAYDEGATLIQKRCPVMDDDTVESLSARVLELEHEAYPEALESVVRRYARP